MQYFFQVIQQHLLDALAAVFMAALVAYFAVRNSERGRHAVACEKFRAAMHATLFGLYPNPVDWPSGSFAIIDILGEKFMALDRAVSEFAYHLPPWRRLLLSCCRFQGHLVKVRSETGGGIWERDGNSAGSSSSRP